MAEIDVFTALGNPVRRRVLELLLIQPLTVNALVEHFDLHRPAVSEHLQVLRNAGLVRDERRGRERYYHVEPAILLEARGWFQPFEIYWRQRMSALSVVLDEENHE